MIFMWPYVKKIGVRVVIFLKPTVYMYLNLSDTIVFLNTVKENKEKP